MNTKIKKATRHTNQNEGLIFEKSSPAKRAFELPPLDVPAARASPRGITPSIWACTRWVPAP
jgi:hypothetical protein